MTYIVTVTTEYGEFEHFADSMLSALVWAANWLDHHITIKRMVPDFDRYYS